MCYTEGCGIWKGSAKEMEKAEELASESDLVVLVLGGSSSRYEGVSYDKNGAAKTDQGAISMECGEGMDVSRLELPEIQLELLHRVSAVNANVVTIVVAGRPYAITEAVEQSKALFYAPYFGPWGGRAVAGILFGADEPEGRLSFSIPRSSGQIPVYYNYKKSYTGMHYCDSPKGGPLFSFGEGMAYTTFSYSEMSIEEKEKGTYEVSIHIVNTGERMGCAVPQLYIQRLESSVVPRVRELKGFQKLSIGPNEKKIAKLIVNKSDLGAWNTNMKYEVEPGKVEFSVWDQGIQHCKQIIRIK